jgi:hypothetical protein
MITWIAKAQTTGEWWQLTSIQVYLATRPDIFPAVILFLNSSLLES